MYGASSLLRVKEIEENRRILIEWDEPATQVEWRFIPGADDTTLATITETGFSGDADQMAARAVDSMGGFTKILCALKVLLEHGIVLPVVMDSYPEGFET